MAGLALSGLRDGKLPFLMSGSAWRCNLPGLSGTRPTQTGLKKFWIDLLIHLVRTHKDWYIAECNIK